MRQSQLRIRARLNLCYGKTDQRGDCVYRAGLLGGNCMPTATQEAVGSSREERIQRAIALLNEALHIIDELEDCTVIGARLQDIIDRLAEERDD